MGKASDQLPPPKYPHGEEIDPSKPMNYAVVTLSKYAALANNLIQSIARHHKEPPDVVVICDNHGGEEIIKPWDGISCVPLYSTPFSYATNGNEGIRRVLPKNIALVNDDALVIQDDFFHKMNALGESYPTIGILSPLIRGGVGNPYQDERRVRQLWPKRHSGIIHVEGRTSNSLPLCFVCVWLRASMVSQIGWLDENFVGGNMEDNDYCLRARRAEWKTSIYRSGIIQHGDGSEGLNRGKNYSLSLSQDPNAHANSAANLAYFKKKYGGTKADFKYLQSTL